jgi:DNA-binding transcriptional MerR regulator
VSRDTHAVDPDVTAADPTLRIGAAAERAGVSTRTLRYYQEVGLLEPSGRSPGGDRRYSEADLERLARILRLRDVMGFDLDRIRVILAADDRILELRSEVRAGVSQTRRREIVHEAIELNHHQRELVREKLQLLQAFNDELEATAERYRAKADELGVTIVEP